MTMRWCSQPTSRPWTFLVLLGLVSICHGDSHTLEQSDELSPVGANEQPRLSLEGSHEEQFGHFDGQANEATLGFGSMEAKASEEMEPEAKPEPDFSQDQFGEDLVEDEGDIGSVIESFRTQLEDANQQIRQDARTASIPRTH
eukprot:maker-scaffold933_size79438-snap-gene-0.19 protein:Tk10368 transcript:maker-scaffold933_size79438-snap-gene-0.19-mRNA-1 annotation:"hypothetical protein L484_012012"